MLRRPSVRIAAVVLRPYLRLSARARAFSSAPRDSEKAPPPAANDEPSEAEARMEAYRQVQNLDFMTAAKILFTTPPKKKKFGLDFHLVQLFMACMPSLAVYLVAQYARYEIRRMEAEVEEKKKQAEEEEKAKEAEMDTDVEGSDNELSRVIVRLDALEETIKDIVDEKKKTAPSSLSKNQAVDKKEPVNASTDKTPDPHSQLGTEHSEKAARVAVSGSDSGYKVAAKESGSNNANS